jgi:tetratricopeptide (TPR) repeat protein
MNIFSNPRVIKRFIVLTTIATVAMFSVWAVVNSYLQSPPGDYEVRQGDILIGDKKYDQALGRFNAALTLSPNHRGALMGRALVFMLTKRRFKAEAEFTNLINFLTNNVAADDRTGVGTLAAAYANRGILYDRNGQYKKALADYIMALKTDEGAVSGPGIVDKVVYGTTNPATVRKRAAYIERQLALPPEKRLLRLPQKDAKQRMYKP